MPIEPRAALRHLLPVVVVAAVIGPGYAGAGQAAPRPSPLARFTRVCHLVVNLPKAGDVGVRADSLQRRVVLDLPAIPRRAVSRLRVQAQAGGGQVVATRRAKGRVVVDLAFNFDNQRVEHEILENPRRLALDVGVGRILEPGKPWMRYAEFLPPGEPDTQVLLRLENALAEGVAGDPPPESEVLSLKNTRTGLLTCVRLADLAAAGRDWQRAAKVVKTCALRARVVQSPVETLARQRFLAYGGGLFAKPRWALLEPGNDLEGWLEAELIFQLVRLRHARGDYAESVDRAFELIRRHASSPRELHVKPLAYDCLQRLANRESLNGRFAQAAGSLLKGLRWLRPLAREQRHVLVTAAATALIKAGTPDIAVRLLSWHLRDHLDGRADPGILILLAEAFFRRGDAYRASRTLDFLDAQSVRRRKHPAADLLRADIMAAAGRKQEAIGTYRGILKRDPPPPLAALAGLRAADLLREQGKLDEALRVVMDAVGLSRSLEQTQAYQALVMLQCDLAYSLGKKRLARACYREVLAKQGDLDRLAVARFRLQRLGGGVASLPADDKLRGPRALLWEQARALDARVGALEGGGK